MGGLSRTFCLLLVCWSTLRAAGKKETKVSGSQKCEKGVFGSLLKDATVPLCGAHFPDDKAKSGWLVLFYKKDAIGLQDVMNRVAMDLGNEPPEKSKAQKKPAKKQRTRIKDLAEKWEFEANIPKRGLEERGKEPLLKVGAVCCDCGSGEEQALCKNSELGVRLVQTKKNEKVMPGGQEVDSEKIMRWTMGELGFVKGYTAADAGDASQGEAKKSEEKVKPEKAKAEDHEDLNKKLEELQTRKAKAVADEDFKGAKELKKEITEVEERIKAKPKVEDPASLKEKLATLKESKKKATADENYELAGKLKKEIADVESRMKKSEL